MLMGNSLPLTSFNEFLTQINKNCIKAITLKTLYSNNNTNNDKQRWRRHKSQVTDSIFHQQRVSNKLE